MPTPFFDDDSWPAVLRNSMRSVSTRAPATLVTATTVFTITGGAIHIFNLMSEQIAANAASPASTLQWSADPTVGSAVTFTGATATLASAAAGTLVICNLTALTTAPDIVANGVALGPVLARGVIIPAGIITTTVGVGSTTGTYLHH